MAVVLTGVFTHSIRQPVARLLGKLRQKRQHPPGIPVLVYQMGKVGSASMYHSLLKQYSGTTTHAHTCAVDDPVPRNPPPMNGRFASAVPSKLSR